MRKIKEKTSIYFTEKNTHICFNENNKERSNNLIDQAMQWYQSFRARLNALSTKSQIFRT